MSNVEWLKRHNAIAIKQTLFRKELTDTPKLLFLDEYIIRDQTTKNILWYAQFHYTQPWMPPHRYVSGRLKTVKEHSAGIRVGAGTDASTEASTDVGTDASSPFDLAPPSDTNGPQKLAYLRSEISQKAAKNLFFAVSKAKFRWRFWLPGQ